MKPTIYIDMDDTIADFKTTYHIGKENAQTDLERLYPQSRVGFFLELEPLPGAIEGVEELISMGYDVNFLTRPSIYNVHCYTEKAQWIVRHFGQEMLNNLYFGCDKTKLIGDYLIDDHISNAGFKGRFIQHGTDNFPNWDAVLKHIKLMEDDTKTYHKKLRGTEKSKIEHLLNLENDEIKAMYNNWDKGDCSVVGLLKILTFQEILYNELDPHYDGDHYKLKRVINGE